MVEDGKEVLIPTFPSVMNIADVSGVTRSGRIFVVVVPTRTEDVVIEKSSQEKTPVIQVGQSSIVNQNVDQDEVLKLIKKSDFNMVDQLLHIPSKIFVLSLLTSSEAHREDLQKTVIESVFGLVVKFRTYSFLRNRNRRSGSPPTAENAEDSAFCLVLAQKLLFCLR
ncbi:hypothetical protein KIW84_043359 [Lathyrus oleraceus]|uniref:Uncharacterized protein n=1 Tax=Pisum sativum TaxID=3888 RepID=A0A9D4XEZ4_PEA|nr:hypothetical protein KIW84_043359 [Pisum sativum]